MGAGSPYQITKDEEVVLYQKLQEEYEIKKGAKMILTEKEEQEIYLILQNTYKKMVIDMKRDEYLANQDRSAAQSDANQATLPAVFLKVNEPKQRRSSMSTEAAAKRLGMGDVSSSVYSDFCVGDIVRGKPEGEFMWFEGVVLEIDGDTFQVDFDGDVQEVKRHNCQRVLSWNSLELGDVVQAQPEGEFNYYTAMVIGINSDETYTISFEGDDEVEDHVPLERIRKICSNRSAAFKKWKKAFHTIIAFNSNLNFQMFKRNSQFMDDLTAEDCEPISSDI